jgi:hypothetical protein
MFSPREKFRSIPSSAIIGKEGGGLMAWIAGWRWEKRAE